jgi:hypothetical protein
LLNSRTLVSSSVVHLFTISSSVLPLSMDGGGIATTGGPAVLVVVVVAAILGMDANNQSETQGSQRLGLRLTSGGRCIFISSE